MDRQLCPMHRGAGKANVVHHAEMAVFTIQVPRTESGWTSLLSDAQLPSSTESGFHNATMRFTPERSLALHVGVDAGPLPTGIGMLGASEGDRPVGPGRREGGG